MHTTPEAELSIRIEKFQSEMAARDIAGSLVLQNSDLFYFSGCIWPAYLFIPVEGKPVFLNRNRGVLKTPRNWPAAQLDNLNKLPDILQEFGLAAAGNIGLELDILPFTFWQRLQKALPGREFTDVGRLIRQIRAVKSPWEINVMRSYAPKDLALWGQAPEIISRARTDLDLAAEFDAQARKLGHQGIIRLRGFNMEMSTSCVTAGEPGAALAAYDAPICGTGLSPSFPFGAAGIELKPGQPVTIDFGSCYSAYVLDHTRLFAINYLPPEGMHAFEIALAIQQETVSLMKPGVSCGDLFERARVMAEKAGLLEGFMGALGGVPFLGHGVGLDVDELPVLARGSREILEEGMVIAVEPKFALPGIGAVGIENCYAVTAQGTERLTPSPDDLQIVKK